jgi:hypothetical protein
MFTSSISEEINTLSLTGPQRNTPAIAAGGVVMAGIVVVRSTSLTVTDGLTEKTMCFVSF